MPQPAMPTATTYGVLAKMLEDLCLSNESVKTFRLGPVTSIEIPTAGDPNQNSFGYPYIHMVPQTARMNGRSTFFEFDMIVMDLAKDNLGLETTVHSQTLEITRDILSKFTLTTWEQFRYNVVMPADATPFIENYQNSVAGWTTRLSIEAITPLNLCDAAFLAPNAIRS
jgi:hypothetical protein